VSRTGNCGDTTDVAEKGKLNWPATASGWDDRDPIKVFSTLLRWFQIRFVLFVAWQNGRINTVMT
jgi:hypothetical protein